MKFKLKELKMFVRLNMAEDVSVKHGKEPIILYLNNIKLSELHLASMG